MKDIEYLSGGGEVSAAPLRVFEPAAVEFLTRLSERILGDAGCRRYADLVSLGFYLRRANLRALIDSYGDVSARVGRGLCFHVTPANIPLNFAYSYVFALLAGNSSVVRLSERPFPQVDLFFKVFNALSGEYPETARRSAFVRCPHASAAPGGFSARADCRMLWGGNETIAYFRSLKTPPRCVDLCFYDRCSAALIDCGALARLDESALKAAAGNFYNDTFAVDQNACSSPRLIFWLNAAEDAKRRFFAALARLARERYELKEELAVSKYTRLCRDFIERPDLELIPGEDNYICRVKIGKLRESADSYSFRGGYFYEYDLRSLSELFSLITPAFQTLVTLGFDSRDLRERLIAARCPGVDRVAAVGGALNVSTVWDGFDLIKTLSRKISV